MSNDSVSQDQLKAFVERIERMDEELAAINGDKKEIYAEAKGNGFDVKVLKKVIAIRRQDHTERMEQEAILELYLSALGMAAAPLDDDDYEPVARAPAPTREPIAAQPKADFFDGASRASLDRAEGEADGQPIQPETAAQTVPVQEPVVLSGAGLGAVESPATNVHPIRKAWQHSDPPHPHCLKPKFCGGLSNHGLCVDCKAAADTRQTHSVVAS